MAQPPSPSTNPPSQYNKEKLIRKITFPTEDNGGIISHVVRMVMASFNNSFNNIRIYNESKDVFLPMLIILLRNVRRVQMQQHSMSRRLLTFNFAYADELKNIGDPNEAGLETSFYSNINKIMNWLEEEGRRNRWNIKNVINGDEMPSDVSIKYINTGKKVGVANFDVNILVDTNIMYDEININDYSTNPAERVSFKVYGVPIEDSEGNTSWAGGSGTIVMPAIYKEEVIIE